MNFARLRSPVLTVKEVATYLRISESTAYRMAERGALPAFKVGSNWRFNLEDIDRWRLRQHQPA